jgi:DNA-binding transcriptional MocR family regulator
MTVAMAAAILDRHQEYSRADLIHENRGILTNWSKLHADVLVISAPKGGTTACLTIRTKSDEMELFDRFIKNGILLVPGKRCFRF